MTRLRLFGRIAGILVFGIACFGVGFIKGIDWGAGALADIVTRNQAFQLEEEVRTLRMFRDGQVDQGTAALEARLDHDVIGLVPGPAAGSITKEKVKSALGVAAKYRFEHPWQSQYGPTIDEAVTNRLSSPVGNEGVIRPRPSP